MCDRLAPARKEKKRKEFYFFVSQSKHQRGFSICQDKLTLVSKGESNHRPGLNLYYRVRGRQWGFLNIGLSTWCYWLNMLRKTELTMNHYDFPLRPKDFVTGFLNTGSIYTSHPVVAV